MGFQSLENQTPQAVRCTHHNWWSGAGPTVHSYLAAAVDNSEDFANFVGTCATCGHPAVGETAGANRAKTDRCSGHRTYGTLMGLAAPYDMVPNPHPHDGRALVHSI